MLDNLRDQAASSPFFQQEEPIAEQAPEGPPPRKTIDQLTGMNARQRLILAAMLLVVVCLLGTMALLVTGRFVLPFF
ncbi:MAG: hypothetical protein FD146_1425 [Anaerolineaceae bacterium]|nr:MAG: hypothetical protein FD146_1425 [Anaerolineaceae bacterium]